MKIKCKQCGEVFEGKTRGERKIKYCSRECYWKSLIGKPSKRKGVPMSKESRIKLSLTQGGNGLKPTTIICQYCKKPFEVAYGHRNKKHCSFECSRKSRIGCIPWNKNQKLVICKQCKIKFSVHQKSNQKFCSNECSYKGRKTRPVELLIKKVCEYCGKSYDVWEKRSVSRFCSFECYWSYTREHPEETYNWNGGREKTEERSRIRNQEGRKTLNGDAGKSYIKHIMVQNIDGKHLSTCDIPDSLVELKRVQLKITRELRNDRKTGDSAR